MFTVSCYLELGATLTHTCSSINDGKKAWYGGVEDSKIECQENIF